MSQPDQADKIGYKKPPHATRFKPGSSGNPRGRPKVSKTLSQLVDEELRSTAIFRVNGEPTKMPVYRALVRRWVNDALAGKMRAIRFLIRNDVLIVKRRPVVIRLAHGDDKL